MLRISTYLRPMLIVGAALVMAAVSAAPASAAPVTERFRAEFRDDCWRTVTEGTLTWPDPLGTSRLPVVGVEGRLVDASVCADDLRRPFAEFTAYVGNRQVDYRQQYVTSDDWGTQPGNTFRFRMFDADQREFITHIEIRVCRDFGPWLPAFQCGETQTYWAPSYIPPPQPPGPPPVEY